jgi:hypothetical protein
MPDVQSRKSKLIAHLPLVPGLRIRNKSRNSCPVAQDVVLYVEFSADVTSRL